MKKGRRVCLLAQALHELADTVDAKALLRRVADVHRHMLCAELALKQAISHDSDQQKQYNVP